MQPTPPVTITKVDWTWQQRLRFFIIGFSFAAFAPLAPMVVCIWWDLVHWENPIEWQKYGYAAMTAMAQPALQYWREKRALLTLPPGLVLPPEFQPSMTSKSVAVEPSVTQTPAGPMLTKTTTTVEKETQPAAVTPEPPKETKP